MNNYKAYSLIGAALAALATVATTAVLVANSRESHQIVIVAKDMTFTVVGSPKSDGVNHPLRLAAGIVVTIIFRNDDAGMRHDLVLDGLAVRSRVLAYGEQQRLTFTVPHQTGDSIYLCSLHPRMMRGLLTIYPQR